MTDFPPPTPPADSTPEPAAWPPPTGQGLPVYPVAATPADATAGLPFSKLAIAGFVVSCVSIFIFGWLGVLGALFSARAIGAARRGLVRGRGLAIAGFVIGVVGFVAYAIIFLTHQR